MIHDKKPNILLVYPDQMRYDVMSCSGNPVIRTPHLDRVAQEGSLFTNAYTSFPFCCPFRASILTGKYAHKHGMKANHYEIPLGQEFLAKSLKQHGYQTGFAGKWHLDDGRNGGFVEPGDRRLGFDTFIKSMKCHSYIDGIFYRDNGVPLRTGRYEPDHQTDHIIEFMDKALDDPEGRPFFAYVCYGIPHFPNVGSDYYLKLYKPEEITMPADVPEILQESTREFLAKYYGMVTCFDFQMGRLLSWLDHAGITDNTIVMVVSDHGDTVGQHGSPSIWKKSYHRSSNHVPFLIRWPEHVPAGRINDHLVDPSVDIYPTLCDVAGIDIPDEVQGVSLLTIMENPDAPPVHSQLYYQITKEEHGPEAFPHPERGLRTKEWLYVEREGKPVALFDEVNDYNECDNLIDDESYCNIVKEFSKKLSDEMLRLEDNWSEEMIWPPESWTFPFEERFTLESIKERCILEVTRDAARGVVQDNSSGNVRGDIND